MRRLAIVLTVGLSLIALGVSLLTTTVVVRTIVKNYISHVNKKYNITISFQDIKKSNDFGEFEVSKIIAKKDEIFYANVSSLRVKLSPFDFLFRSKSIFECVIDKPDIYLNIADKTGELTKNSVDLSGFANMRVHQGRLYLAKDNKFAFLANNISVSYTGKNKKFDIQLQASDFTASMNDYSLKISDPQIDLKIVKDNINFNGSLALEALSHGTNIIPLRGDIAHEGKISDFISHDWKIEGLLDIADFELGEFYVDYFSSPIAVDRERFDISGGKIHFADADITLNLYTKLNKYLSYRLDVFADDLSLHELLAQIGVFGSFVDLDIDARISGRGQMLPKFHFIGHSTGLASNLNVFGKSARVAKGNLVLNTAQDISFDTDLHVDEREFTFINTVLDDGLSKGKVECSLYFNGNGMNLAADFEKIDFSSISNKIQSLNYRGSGKTKGTVTGPYAKLDIDFDATINGLFVDELYLGDVFGKILFRNPTLSITNSQAKIGKSTVNGEVTINFLENVKLEINADTAKSSLSELSTVIPQTRNHKLFSNADNWGLGLLDGKLNLEGTIRDTLPLLLIGKFSGALSLVGPFELNLTAEQIELLPTQLHPWRGQLHAQGIFNRQTKAVDASLHASSLDVAGVGKVNGNAKVLGPVNSPNAVGHIEVKDLQAGPLSVSKVSSDFTLEKQTIKFKGQDANGGAQFTLETMLTDDLPFEGALEFYHAPSPPGSHLSSSGLTRGSILRSQKVSPRDDKVEAEFTFAGNLGAPSQEAKIRGSGNLQFLPRIFSQLKRSNGNFTLNLNLAEDLRNPKVQGFLDIDHVQLAFKDFVLPISKLKSRLVFQDREARIAYLEANSDAGTIRGAGEINFDSFEVKYLDLEVNYTAVPVIVPLWMSFTSSGHLNFFGAPNDLLLTGGIDIEQATITKEVELDQLSVSLSPKILFIHEGQVKADQIKYDIKLSTVNNIIVKNNVLHGETRADLKLIGTTDSPRFSGTISLQHGEGIFRGVRYDIEQATAEFAQEGRMMPNLNLSARTKILDYEIDLRLDGRLPNPKLVLRSEPALAETDILSLITFGMIASDLKISNAAGGAGLELIAAYTGISEKLQLLLPDSVKNSKLVSVEQVRLTSVFSQQEGASVPAVFMGFQLANGPRLQLQSSLLEDSRGDRKKQIELSHGLGKRMRWRIEWNSEGQSSLGDAGADLWYRWDF